DKGYRFFVDSLDLPLPADNQIEQVKAFFDASHGELERLLQQTTRLLSNLTDCAAVVVGPAAQSATVRSIQVVRVAQRVAIVVAVLSNGAVEKATVEMPTDSTDEQIADASAFLAGHTIGRSLDMGLAEGESDDPIIRRIALDAMAALAADPAIDIDHVFVGGQARMAAAFDAVEQVREVLSVLERQLVVVSLIRDVLARGQSVSIGSESGVEPLNECSLVVAPYEVDGRQVGTIGVLGPTRLNYPQALSAVAVVSQRLGDRLSEG
ncbi:MAG TPA: hypothetical protein VGQ20_10535, partial [Acidimicrobiales bacterium]|nr:hypothetical protein [Acidimicrobiales bacterium]